MKEYIVKVDFNQGCGYSILTNCYAVYGETMKEAKEYAITLIPAGFEVVRVSAHRVKDGEEVDPMYYSWIYR